ncbi:MAG TPA: M48 family metalloprotease [Acidimicrobiales bacterium]|nr:M48 family metalloprotease [Acidimicrobiales bacterium]
MSRQMATEIPSPYAFHPGSVARNRRRAMALVAGAAAMPALVLLAVVALAWSAAVGVVAGAVLATALSVWLWRAGPRAVIGRLDGAPADPVVHARLHNLVESLCAAAGLSKPELLVVRAPAANALSVGHGPSDATLVVTEGLLTRLTRVELEAILAHELSHVRKGEVAVAAAAAVTIAPLMRVVPTLVTPLGRRLVGGREADADLAAVGLTRYPPGLIGALEKMRSPRMPPSSPGVDLLWAVPPSGAISGQVEAAVADPLESRLQTLREL